MFEPIKKLAAGTANHARPEVTSSLTILVRGAAITGATVRRTPVDRAAVTGALLAGAALSSTLVHSRRSAAQGDAGYVKLRF